MYKLDFYMTQRHKIQLFEDKKVRTAWDDEREEWYFSIVDVCAVLSESENPRGTRGTGDRHLSQISFSVSCIKIPLC